MVDIVPPDEGCEVLDGEVNNKERDKNGNKYVADSDDTHNLIKWGWVIIKCYRGESFKKCNMTPYN